MNTKPDMDKRSLIRPLELRAAGEGSTGQTAFGYAALFQSESDDLGGFVEVIAPDAFGKLDGDIRALWNHDTNHVLGRTTAGTLRLKADATGLAFEIDLPDTAAGRDAAISMQRGDVTGTSFGFETVRDRWQVLDDGRLLRTLLEVNLFEISPTAFPAYTLTSAAVRSLSQFRAGISPEAKALRQRMDMTLRLAAAR